MFDTQKVAVAIDSHAKLDLSSTHETTSSFMQLQPVYYHHMIPNEHLTGQGFSICRLAPVAVPTYGRCRINLRTYFVPFRTIFPNFNEFITDSIGCNYTANSLVDGSPYIMNSDFITYFTTFNDPFGSPLVTQVTDSQAITDGLYDFYNNDDNKYYRFSFYGRMYHKILQSLGYRVVWNTSKQTSDYALSALALLAYAKVYLDWYANQAYLDSGDYLTMSRWFKFNDPASSFHFDYNCLDVFFHFVGLVCYDNGNDVFINAWDSPVAPNGGNFTPTLGGQDISVTTPTSVSVGLDANGTPVMLQGSAANTTIGSEYIHQFLKSMTDYLKRNQLSGAAAVDRFLARFGIALDSAKANRSIYISAKSFDIQFGDVMQTANTAGPGNTSNLADYGGVGNGKGGITFDFKSDEFGIFLTMASIVPQSRLYQGLDRNNLHLSKMQFFTPEFDNLGCASIAKAEVYVSNVGSYATPTNMMGIFGYAPRYYEYKQKQDYVTGDFVSKPTMRGGNAWHLNRELSDATFGIVANQVHSLNFTRGKDCSQYSRIFNYNKSDIDNFYIIYHFDVKSESPCKSLFDTYDFDSLGKQISMNGNSAKVN